MKKILIWITAFIMMISSAYSLTISTFNISIENNPVNCTEKEQLFDGRCYSCNSEIGYLQFNPNDRSIICIGCNEGFKLNKDTKKCELLPPVSMQQKFNFYFDETAKRISKFFGIQNLIVGFVIIFIILFILGYYIIKWLTENA